MSARTNIVTFPGHCYECGKVGGITVAQGNPDGHNSYAFMPPSGWKVGFDRCVAMFVCPTCAPKYDGKKYDA